MVTSIVFITLIGTLQFNSAISAAINYEPIKINVNENFNAQPGQVSSELQETGILHQGANFYFKPQLNLLPSYIPSDIEALISLIQQQHHSCSKDASKVIVEKDKLIKILKPFMYPVSETSKEMLSEKVLEKENKLENVKPIIITEELKPVTPEFLVIPKAPVLAPLSYNGIPPVVEEEVKKEESIILEEPTGVFPTIPEIAVGPITEPIINYVEPKPITSGLAVIPEAPLLPPLSLNDIHVVGEEVKSVQPIVIDVEPKPAIQELVAIPEAPVLPSFSLNDISSILEEQAKKEKSVIFKEPVGVFPTIPEIDVRLIEEPVIDYVEPKPINSELVVIPEAPVLPPLSFNGIPPIVEEVKKEESIIQEESIGVLPEPTIIEVEPKPFTSKLVVIPEAPILPPLSLHVNPSILEEEVKKEESIIFEEPTGVFPTIPELAVRPITESIINYVEPKPITSGLVVIPEAPLLPPLSLNDIQVVEPGMEIVEPIIVDVEPKPAIQKLLAIPEVPVLPSFSLHDISFKFQEQAKNEESAIFKEPVGVFPAIPEIDARPIEEPIINYIEPKPITSELVVIPEAPVLPPLSFNGIPPIVEEEVKKEESIILEESTGVLPEPTIIEVEPKPFTSELVVIPEAPVLPPLSLHVNPSIVEEESIIFEEPRGVFPTIPELAVRPITEPIINYVEPKPSTSGLPVIPEAPLLPPLSLNDIHVGGEEVKSVEPIVVDVEPKPVIQELVAIPEAPELPSFSLHDISSIFKEQAKKEESVIFKEPVGVFPIIPEIDVRLIDEPIIDYVEPKPITSELVVIPEAPVLPPLSFNGIPPIVEEEVKKEESIILEKSTGLLTEPTIIEVEPKPFTSELVVIPEAPVLPPLSLDVNPSIVEGEVKKEESIILEKPMGMFPLIPELAVRPITEPYINTVKPKPINVELLVIPEAPLLPPPSANNIHVVEEVKIEEPIIVGVEPKPSIQELVVIPEAPVLPPLSLHVNPSIVEEESIIFEEPTGVFPTIPELTVRPITEPIINYVEPKPSTSGLLVIPEAPLLPPLSLNDIHVGGEEVKSVEPIVVDVEPKPAIQELVAIPEAPELPSFSLHDISSIFKEQAKKEESVIFKEPVGVFPTIPEIDVRLIDEPIIDYVEPKPITSELVVIPEAPVLPPLSFNGIPPIVEEEVKKEESIILEESTGLLTEPTIIEVEPKPFTSELVVIPEAPVLPPLSLDVNPSIVEGKVKKEESIILEKPLGMFPLIPELAVRPITEPYINTVKPKPINVEFVVIPEAPLLPPLSANNIHVIEEVKIEEPIIVDVEPKPSIQKLVVIPEAPVLPPLSLDVNPSIVEEEVKKEESIILEKPMGMFPLIPELAVRPIMEPYINNVKPKPINTELVVIPEAPVLPPLSANDIHVVEEMKIEKPIVVDVEPKPSIQELVVIPEAPVLPPLSLYVNPTIVEEELKKEESIILEKPTGVFPTIPEITVRPIPEPITNYVEPKPITPISKMSVRPISSEPIITDVEHRLITLGLVVIPEAPVLPKRSYNVIPPVIEDVKIEESINVEESTRVFPSISEISARPFREPLVVSETAESFPLEKNTSPMATEEMKIEVPILFEESIEVFPPIAEISSGPTLQESEITDSYELEEVSQPKPESVVTVKQTLPHTIISKPSNNLRVFSYVPFVSHLSNRAPKTKNLMMPKPAALERFLLKKHPFRLPAAPFPKLDLNAIKSSIWGNKKQFLYPTSYAHDVIEKRIAPNMVFKKQNAPKRVKIYIRSKVPKRPSYL